MFAQFVGSIRFSKVAVLFLGVPGAQPQFKKERPYKFTLFLLQRWNKVSLFFFVKRFLKPVSVSL